MKIDCKILLIENVTEVELKQTNKETLTEPMVFCCLVLSAMKLQASTHCLISGAAWAKLLYRLAVLLTSILSTRGRETLR